MTTLHLHVCKEETLRIAYSLDKKNNGAPGIDGVTYEAIEATGVESFLEPGADTGRTPDANVSTVAEPTKGDT